MCAFKVYMRRSMFSSMQDFPFYRILLNLVELVKILASCSPHKTFSPDVVCVRYARGFCFSDDLTIFFEVV